jgi:predicted glycoside hydrolase/deacetylase ChbG (UPF0249 family)
MASKKYLIIHADDAGLAWSENKATQEGILHGSISSTSLMVPCPWFYEMAQFCLDYPDTDYGIHLTLTGEWKTFPFRCVSNPDTIPSLVDNHGFFFKKRTQIRDYAKLDEVRRELKNQIDYALFMGLKPSHLDSHMYTLGLRQDLLDLYIELGKEYKLPILLSKKLIAYTGENPTKFHLPEGCCLENIFMASLNQLENEGLPAYYDHILESLPEGLSIILIHPAKSSSEMDQITINHPNFGAQWRAEDANYFSSLACKQKLKENNIELVNFKNLEVLNLLGA